MTQQFTRDTVLNDSGNAFARIFSVQTSRPERKGLAVFDEGRITLVKSNGELGIWDMASVRGNPGHRLKAESSEVISESAFEDAIETVKQGGVGNIAAKALRVVYAESSDIRARLLGARRERSSFSIPWVKFASKPVATDTLRALGVTPKALMALEAEGLIKECKEPVND
ncbi:MAG: hypothetical protein MN733_05490 [Nitrososphaera sp.]|nr:hypothetical protein [Nitrososphaera sp.]